MSGVALAHVAAVVDGGVGDVVGADVVGDVERALKLKVVVVVGPGVAFERFVDVNGLLLVGLFDGG